METIVDSVTKALVIKIQQLPPPPPYIFESPNLPPLTPNPGCSPAIIILNNLQVKVLRSISPITRDNIILGQYAGDPNGEGDAKLSYLDDETVPKGSITPTYAMAALFIKNERWDGVPFIVKCGKGKTTAL